MTLVGSLAQSQMSMFLEYLFLQKSVVMPLKKHGRSSQAWHGFFRQVKIIVCFVCQVYLKINQLVTVLGQGRKVIDQHSYLIHSWQ